MEVIGNLIQLTQEQRGEGQNGPWVRGGFVLETLDQFPRKIYFSTWGEDKLMMIKNLPLGSQIKVIFTIESREYQERWYTDCRCTNVETFQSAMPPQMPTQNPYNNPPQPQMTPSTPQPTPNPQPVQESQTTYQTPPQSIQPNTAMNTQNSMPQEEDDLPF